MSLITDMGQFQYSQIQTSKINSHALKGDNKKLYETSKEFEAIFIKQMLNSMKKTVNKSGLMEGGMAEDIFEDMLYDKYAQKMADTADFGVADTLYNQLSYIQNLSK
ncbi:rod-binding protein [Spirochaeta cellobiosiphila]|uniref:rod-binding protein n=1 Tax=Spirochaeta cellobiosiphila TaxID=504483 RepID=UPI0003F9E573|nr:rod-binding protein [Spirochaeta cellobiosiphila]